MIAHEAYKRSQKGKPEKIIDGFTPDQRFFLGLTTFECGHARPEYLRKQVVVDPHSPSRFRINGPLPHVDSFYEAFEVTQKHKLYRKEDDRARIW